MILVDGDLHRPRQHRVFGLRNHTGLTTALIANVAGSLDDILQDTGVTGLRVLTSGPLPPNAAELLGSTRMRELPVDLHTRADVVVIDSPPVTALSDAAVLAMQTDGVLLVLDAGKTRRELARSVKANLRGIGRPAAQSGNPSGLKPRSFRPPFSLKGTAAKPPASWKYWWTFGEVIPIERAEQVEILVGHRIVSHECGQHGGGPGQLGQVGLAQRPAGRWHRRLGRGPAVGVAGQGQQVASPGEYG